MLSRSITLAPRSLGPGLNHNFDTLSTLFVILMTGVYKLFVVYISGVYFKTKMIIIWLLDVCSLLKVNLYGFIHFTLQLKFPSKTLRKQIFLSNLKSALRRLSVAACYAEIGNNFWLIFIVIFYVLYVFFSSYLCYVFNA